MSAARAHGPVAAAAPCCVQHLFVVPWASESLLLHTYRRLGIVAEILANNTRQADLGYNRSSIFGRRLDSLLHLWALTGFADGTQNFDVLPARR